MKRIKFYPILSSILTVFILISCVEDGDFTLPDVSIEEPDITPNSSVLAVKTALQQEFTANENVIHTFFDNPSNPTYIEAYVVSNDAVGNFYKKLIVQDKTEKPTAGIEIAIDNNSLSESYEIGRKIYIKLDGLSVSYNDGESTTNIDPFNGIPGKYILGILDRGEVKNIPATSIKNHIWRSATVSEIVPNKITLADITGAHINTMIQVSATQFLKSDLGKTFAGESNDEFDGFRTIFECNSQQKIFLQTSTFSSFKSNIIPQGKGSFTSILSKNYNSDILVAIINKPSNLNFTDANRCDPAVFECDTATAGGSIILLEEDFENITSTSGIIDAGWTNVNVNGGTVIYSSKKSLGNRFLEISAFNSDESPLEAWLISPEVDLDTTTHEELTFETNTGYDNGKALSVYISSDFSGDITTATWLEIEDVILSEGPSFGYNKFKSSGSINISCLSGKVHVAFKYLGSEGVVTTTYRIDNVKVTGE